MAQKRMNIQIVEDNFPQLQKAVEDLNKYQLHIGIFGDGGETEDGESYVMIANVHEFGMVIDFKTKEGSVTIPERSFMRSTFDEKEREWVAFLEERIERVFGFQMTVEQAYEQMGAKAASDIQSKIRDLRDPPNADSTIAKKGSSNPLIDQGGAGGLMSKVTWKVVRD